MAVYAPSAALSSTQKSTTVRSVPWALRASFSAASTLTPRLAALAAERLFLSPPHHRQPVAERDALARGREFRVRGAGQSLRGWRFGSGPTVLLVHGWGGRGGQLAPFFEPLEDAGFSVVTFDAPAHGRSEGRLASAPVFAEAVADVARRVGARAALGHSLGGAALAAAVADGLELDAAVLVAPPRSPVEFLRMFVEALQLKPETAEAVQARIERRYGIPMHEYDLPRRVGTLTTPALVFHDRADAEVPWADGEAIARSWPGAELVTTSGLGHRRILRDVEVVDRAVTFLAGHLERCSTCERLAVRGHGLEARCATCALGDELADLPRRWPSRADPFDARDVHLGRVSTERVLQGRWA